MKNVQERALKAKAEAERKEREKQERVRKEQLEVFTMKKALRVRSLFLF